MKKNGFSRRVLILGAIKLSMLLIIISRFVYLQLLQTQNFKLLARQNSIRFIPIPPPRGRILDRNRILIAGNRLVYKATISKYHITQINLIEKRLKQILNIKNLNISALNEQSQSSEYITIKEDISWDEIAKIKADFTLQNVEILKDYKRFYTDIAPHIIGHLGAPTKSDINQLNLQANHILKIGVSGIEKACNKDLIGMPGMIQVEVNAKNNAVRELEYKPPIQGKEIVLSINAAMQKATQEELEKIDGGAILISLENYNILAMHSSPAFDPNEFVRGIKQEKWSSLQNNPNNPLINKVISAAYAPGSVFKIISALALLKANIDPNTRIHCKGAHKIGNRVMHCWRKFGHGSVDLRSAISESCNVFFYVMSANLKIHHITDTAFELGLGALTGIELPSESAGLIPDKKSMNARGIYQKLLPGDIANIVIGQGYVLTTLMQLAVMISRVATGNLITPTIFAKAPNFKQYKKINVESSHLEILRQSLNLYNPSNIKSVINHTNQKKSSNWNIAGKTGTAQIKSKKLNEKHAGKTDADHGFFVGFAPFDNPKYAIATMVMHGGWGSASALPLAMKILQKCIQ
ncbi:MAG: penicillin-binding protein 2 [Proteobacteria bacterium]|nr:penicillin-binding protein 2 [Pseudomonadota bacterium]